MPHERPIDAFESFVGILIYYAPLPKHLQKSCADDVKAYNCTLSLALNCAARFPKNNAQ
jgi:hypothetical protein